MQVVVPLNELRYLLVFPPILEKPPPTTIELPKTVIALTLSIAFGFHSDATPVEPSKAASPFRLLPPMEVKAPPA